MGAYAPLDADDVNQRHSLGQIRIHPNGNMYRYIKYDDGTANIAAVEGLVVYHVGTVDWVVTPDVSDTSLSRRAGVIVATITNLQFGWMLVEGIYPTVTTDGGGDIVAGNTLVADGDGRVDILAATEENIGVGVALTDDTATDVRAAVKLNV